MEHCQIHICWRWEQNRTLRSRLSLLFAQSLWLLLSPFLNHLQHKHSPKTKKMPKKYVGSDNFRGKWHWKFIFFQSSIIVWGHFLDNPNDFGISEHALFQPRFIRDLPTFNSAKISVPIFPCTFISTVENYLTKSPIIFKRKIEIWKKSRQVVSKWPSDYRRFSSHAEITDRKIDHPLHSQQWRPTACAPDCTIRTDIAACLHVGQCKDNSKCKCPPFYLH